MSTDEITEQTTARRAVRLRYVIPLILVVPLTVLVVLAAVVAGAKPAIRLSSDSLAKITLPYGGGKVVRVSAVGGREQKVVRVKLRGDQVWPTQQVAPGERITVVATIDRPSWISWVAGKSERITLSEVTPVARVASIYITHTAGKPLTVRFRQPVQVVGSGAPGADFDPRPLAAAETSMTLRASAPAGTIAVAAAVRPWERTSTTTVSWFPRGKRASAVALPAPGTRITPSTPITLTFSRPVRQVLGNHRPPVNPTTTGAWHNINARTIEFVPTGYGYGLGATVNVLLPATVYLIGAKQSASSPGSTSTGTTTSTTTSTTTGTTTTAGTTTSTGTSSDSVVGTWTEPQPSTFALQQFLAELGYLPVTFTATPEKVTATTGTTTTPGVTIGTDTDTTATDTTTIQTTTTTPTASGTPVSASPKAVNSLPVGVAAAELAATDPPAGKFSWRYPNTPGQLKALWSPTSWTELTKGAVMAFEETVGMTPDGVAGPAVWQALINAAVKDQRSTFGYTFVMVSEKLPESVHVWHNGKIVVHGPVNTGISVAPTALGTYAVYEHLTVTTMSGLNPDGTPYHDPGIPWVSYFNGGDALHGFIRASYGWPQSLGCVEMPYAQAGAVWPYTPIGTIVHLT